MCRHQTRPRWLLDRCLAGTCWRPSSSGPGLHPFTQQTQQQVRPLLWPLSVQDTAVLSLALRCTPIWLAARGHPHLLHIELPAASGLQLHLLLDRSASCRCCCGGRHGAWPDACDVHERSQRDHWLSPGPGRHACLLCGRCAVAVMCCLAACQKAAVCCRLNTPVRDLSASMPYSAAVPHAPRN